LYVKGRHVTFQRAKRTQKPSTSILKLEGVDTIEAARFYEGKKVAYVYRAQKQKLGTKVRVIWGKVTRPHGNNGQVRAKFRKNLPTNSLGEEVRVMLYPSHV